MATRTTRILFFLYWISCEGRRGRNTSNLAFQGPVEPQVAREWVKDICPHLIMFWLCLVTCEYVQLTHIHTFTHKEVIFTLSWSNRKSHLWEVNLFELTQSLCWSWLSCFGVLWWNFWVHLSIKSNYQQIVIVWVVPFQFVSLWPHFFLIGRARTSSTIFNR